MPLDIANIRQQFPLLKQQIDGNPLVYLDSAATAPMHASALEMVEMFETTSRANVHRGMHVLAERATGAYESARQTVCNFLHASRHEEIVFTKNCTEAINLVAQSWGKENLQSGDTVLLSVLEHHSNIVPWLQLKDEIGILVEWVELDADWENAIDKHQPKLVAVTGQSNVIGTQPSLKEIVEIAHNADALVLVDAAQLAAHKKIDVQDLDCDFLAFSGHKVYGPTGVGILYGKRELLEAMPPFLGGGSMIHEVHRDHFTSADIPHKFEAGTPPIAQVIGLDAVLNWLMQLHWEDVEKHEAGLLQFAHESLSSIDNLTILGTSDAADMHGCISFVMDGMHPHDLTEVLGRQGICLRAGHHCTQPLHDALGVPASTRLSVGLFNAKEDILQMKEATEKAIELFN